MPKKKQPAPKKRPKSSPRKPPIKKRIRKIRKADIFAEIPLGQVSTSAIARLTAPPRLEIETFETLEKSLVPNLPPRPDGSPEGMNISQIIEHQRCGYKWHVKYRRMIETRKLQPKLDRGSAVHRGLAEATKLFATFDSPVLTANGRVRLRNAALVGVNAWIDEWCAARGTEEMPADEAEAVEAVADESRQIANMALDNIDLQRFEVLRLNDGTPLIEHKTFMPFLPNFPFYNTCDFAAKDREQGGNWAIDYKVRKTLKPTEDEEVDIQLPAYQRILRHNGVKTDGSIKFQIRAELPRDPSRNKNGSMSRREIITTWEHYKAALIAAGLNVESYEDEMRPKLQTPFYREDRLYRGEFFINQLWEQVIIPQAYAVLQDRQYIRHLHFMNCNGCWARELCLAELRGEDTEFLLGTQYVDSRDPKPRIVLKPDDFVMVED